MMTDISNYLRLLLYPAAIYAIFLLNSKGTRRVAVFSAAALWLGTLELVLILRLLGWAAVYDFVVNYVTTPMLALFVWAEWWTVWKERKRV